MTMDDIEKEIDEELRKLNLDPFENVSEESEDESFIALDASPHSEGLSDSVLAYIQASRTRTNAFEQLIIEDFEGKDSLIQELFVTHNDNIINEGAMDFIEEPTQWKDRVVCGMREQVESQSAQTLSMDVGIDHDICSESELQLSLEWKELEKRLEEEEEQKLEAQKMERALHLNSEREEKEWRKKSLMEFEEQLRKVEKAALFQNVGENNNVHCTVDQQELDKQQEFIWKLEKELEEEKQAFEEAQQEERKRIQELQCRSATKIQAVLRGTLARRWSTRELKRRREEEKRLEEEKREWEKINKEREEERKRTEEVKRFHREEMERRRAEYEASKEQERHRLEEEKRLEQQRRKEEDRGRRGIEMKIEQNNITGVEERHVNEESQCVKAEKILLQQRKKDDDDDDERRKELKRKEEEYNVTNMGESRVKEESQCLASEKKHHQQLKKGEVDERRKEVKGKDEHNVITSVEKRRVKKVSDRHEENVEKNEEYEKRQLVRSSRAENKCQRKEENEERGERAIQGSSEEVRERKVQMERIRDVYKKKTVLDKSEKIDRFDDQKLSKKCYQEKSKDGSEELDCQMDLLQSKEIQKLSTAYPLPCINAHQELSNDHFISLFGSPKTTGHLIFEMTRNTFADQSLNGVEHNMDTRGQQNTTTVLLENCVPEIQELAFECLPDSTEQKRMAWIKNCTPWSILSLQNKKKRPSAQQQSRKRGARRGKLPSSPPLSVDTILKTGAWSSLEQVTTVTLEDLPGCNLSTLSQCYKLKTLTLRRCGLISLDGLNQCSQIRYIDVQENSVTHVDCGGLANLEVLLLGKNQLTNIHGLDDAENLQVLQLSHNNISCISGLGALKMLQRLLVDHNQLLSMRGLNEMYTLLHLDCSYNHLSHAEGLENCALLNTLELRGNSLTQLPVLHNHVLLRDLSLDDNLISSISDLESYWLPLLQDLSLAHNSITDLIPLLDLMSLRTLNISHNCLSDLQNVCLNLQGCFSLQELNLNDNPLKQEMNWRSLLLETVPGLIKLNNEQTSVAAASSKGPRHQWSFQALCQAQQRQRDSLLQKHKMEISSAPSQHDAQLLFSGHCADLFKLAVDQRYAHEYGDSFVTDDPASSTDFSEASPSQRISPEKQPRHTVDPQKTHRELQTNDLQADFPDSCTETQIEMEPVQTLDLEKAAVVIQRCWRRNVLQRRWGLSCLIAKTTERLNIRRMEETSIKRPELPKSDRAAVVIQAAWRGYDLRRRLACALAGARFTESDEDFEEVDTDEFIFDEKAMEKDWISLHSNTSPARAMPYSAHSPLPKPCESPPVNPRLPKHAWSDSKGAVHLEQCVSPHLNSRIFTKYSKSTLRNDTLAERSDKILKEWGFTSNSTALLMLKRAKKMKGSKPQHKRLLVRQVENEVQNGQRVGEPQNYKEKTYQWLHAQAIHPHTDAAVSGRDHFLPEIDRDILYGGRVQLVASVGGRSGVDSRAKLWANTTGVSSPPNKPSQARRHSTEHEKTEVPSPNRVSSAPSRKDRISFRDNPVRQSGGWGGGKKRTQLNK
ncbi:leucine-rich repeat and IQ domain-containing protein 1 isoform X3 [Triplophysa dalaica]|uniref:leucine-rich repeat and IQ domain-containing protein 1 isoform X3 n=1 Tax=Triplophysa dalaica TaxID=1582913 RepID=UPI0024DF73FB|nr:leucine-rich repeat and IQ domain-containing protein 1 isoform X3 [Triplophysa dalaica]